jgi:hypothetical protein
MVNCNRDKSIGCRSAYGFAPSCHASSDTVPVNAPLEATVHPVSVNSVESAVMSHGSAAVGNDGRAHLHVVSRRREGVVPRRR